MSDEKELEEKLLEAIKKKKEVETRFEEVRGKRVAEIEDRLRFLKKFADVEAYLSDRTITVIITPKKEYEYVFQITEPFKYETMLTKNELKNLRDTAEKIAILALDKFMMNYPKPPFLLDFETLARRVGRYRAIEIFMYLCQKGSPYHCSFLYGYLNKLVDECLKTEDKSERSYLAKYIEHAGFKKLAKILTELDIDKLDEREREMIREAIKHGLKEVLSKCARLYERPTDMPESTIKKSWDVVFEACKEPEYMLFPEPVDESPIITVLKRLSARIPELKYVVLEVEGEVKRKEAESRKEKEIKKLEEEIKKLKRERKKLLSEIEMLRREKEKLEKEKELFKERMKKRVKRLRGD